MMETNFYSVVVLTREVVKGMMARNRCGVYFWVFAVVRCVCGCVWQVCVCVCGVCVWGEVLTG